MRKVTFILLLFLVTLLPAQQSRRDSVPAQTKAPVISGANATINITKQQWIEDIRYFGENFTTKHYNAFSVFPKDTFVKKINRLVRKIELQKVVNPIDVAYDLQKIIKLTNDSHSGINTGNFISYTFYPVSIYASGNAYYITGVLPENNAVIGGKIIAYNGIPIENVVKKISDLFCFDNASSQKSQVVNLMITHELLKYLGIVKTNLKIKVAGRNEEIQEITSNPMNQRDFIRKMTYIPRKSKPVTEEYRGIFYWKKIINSETLFVQYNMCKTYGKENWANIRKTELYKKDSLNEAVNFAINNSIPFSDFADSILAILEKPEIKKLVFDLRYNGGGNSYQGTQLIERISKNQKINQKGNIFVLTGRKTFSSAIINTSDFKNNTQAILVGEPTGGKPNHFGEVRNFFLPNSRIMVNYSTKYFQKEPGNSDTIEPDVLIEPTLDDYINGVDPCLEYVLKAK